MDKNIESIINSADVLFMMLGGVMVFAMHGGFAFLEVGTVRKKNQINALVNEAASLASAWERMSIRKTSKCKEINKIQRMNLLIHTKLVLLGLNFVRKMICY